MAEDTSLDAIEAYHQVRGFSQIGYHFYVWRRYGVPHIGIGRPVETMGAHAAGANSGSIGVCLAGNYVSSTPAPDMWNSFLTLVSLLMHRHNLTPQDVYGHKDVGTTPTACPGYDVAQLRDQLAKSL